jgi:hypothetical protein
MSEQLPSRMSVELSLAGGEPVEVYDRAIGPVGMPTPLAAPLRAWNALPAVLRGYLLALAEDRLDEISILTFADWLEEHGQTEAGQRVRLLRPRSGDVLAVWPSADTDDAHFTAGIVCNELANRGFATVLMLFGETLAAADPEQLRAAGWVREEEAVERVRQEREEIARIVEQRGGTNPLPWLEELTYRAADHLAASIRARGDSA